MKIDIYNIIIKKLHKVLLLSSHNNKYSHKDIFDSLLYILNSGCSWNSNIVINNKIIKTNSIYKHFIFLTKIHFFKKTYKYIVNKFFNNHKSNFFSVDTTFIQNKHSSIKNIKRNPYKSNKYGFKISVITNDHNIPVNIFFDKGNIHDLTIFKKQINKPFINKYLINTNILADKAYKSKYLYELFKETYNTNLILPKKSSFYPEFNNKIYSNRTYIEHLFGKIKNYKRCAFNYEYKITNFKNFIYLSLIRLILINYLKVN